MKRGNNVWSWGWGGLILGGILLFSCSTTGGEPVEEPTSASPTISCEQVSIANPAGAYCSLLGYTPGTGETAAGQMSTCTLPGGVVCDAWEFLTGKCGQDHSYCARQGYGIQTVSEGGDPYSQEYAVCLDANGAQLGLVSELSGLRGLMESCTNQ